MTAAVLGVSVSQLDAAWALGFVQRLAALDLPAPIQTGETLTTVEQADRLPMNSIVVSLSRGWAIQAHGLGLFLVAEVGETPKPLDPWYLPVLVLHTGDARRT